MDNKPSTILNQLKTRAFNLKPEDIIKITGLNYRKLNDWEQRGIIPKVKENEKWRQFNLTETFAIAICAELRKKMGLPFEKLEWIHSQIMRDQAHEPLTIAVSRIVQNGGAVSLVSDLNTVQIIESDMLIKKFIFDGKLGSEGFVYLQLNPLINNILSGIFDSKIELEQDSEYRKQNQTIKRRLEEEWGLWQSEEHDIFNLIRSDLYQNIELQIKNGRVVGIKMSAEREVEPGKIEALVKDKNYQNIHLEKLPNGNFKLIGEIIHSYGNEMKEKKVAERGNSKNTSQQD